MLILKEEEKENNVIDKAVQILRAGGIISFATETVYALAVDAANDKAIERLYKIKKRAKEKPIAIFAKDLASAKEILFFNFREEKLATKFMPGALTLILKKKFDNNKISLLLNNGSDYLGLRIPNHQFVLKLLAEFDGFIATTSANIANQAPAISAAEVVKYFNNEVNLVIDGNICQYKIPSTVAKIEEDGTIKILRNGIITEELLTKHK